MSPGQAEAHKRLASLAEKLRTSPESAYQSLAQQVQVQSAIEVTSALIGLNVGVDDLANRIVTVSGNLTAAITAATAQAAESSKEAANLALKSADLSRQLNRLTIWIVLAAGLSALAALIQAGGVVYQILHPSNPEVLVLPLRR